VVESQLESSGLLTFIFLTPRAEAVVTFVWLCIVAPSSSQHLSRLIRFAVRVLPVMQKCSSPWEEKRVRGARLMGKAIGSR
jgi:hypothetical protein